MGYKCCCGRRKKLCLDRLVETAIWRGRTATRSDLIAPSTRAQLQLILPSQRRRTPCNMQKTPRRILYIAHKRNRASIGVRAEGRSLY